MQKHYEITKRRLSHCVPRIFERVYSQITPLKCEYSTSPEPTPWSEVSRLKFHPIRPGETWGKDFDCAWFRFTGTVPAAMKGQEVVALINLGGEGCLFDDAGNPVQGLTHKTDQAVNMELPKRQVKLYRSARGAEKVSLLVEGGANGLFGISPPAALRQADLAVFNREAWDLLFDYTFLLDLMSALPANSRRHQLIFRALNEVANHLGDMTKADLRRCREVLQPELTRPASDSALRVSAIGHAHIDTAWLWPLRETVRKCGRTFATALRMMEEYPDYRFGASQPQLYEFVKEHYPTLYRRIQKAVKAGRWELQGAMWVEADCNIPGGESLVRQLLHGKRFFLEEFDTDIRELWLPDVFGYCAQLPQLLRKSGVDFFMTQKLSWNEFNKMPHNTMIWKGIDGTSIFTHFLPNDSYNSNCTPADLLNVERLNRDNDRVDQALYAFGIGDGGGGPGRGHIERLLRARDIEGLPRFTMEPSKDYAAKAMRSARDLLTWSGELYFECHRGTYTTQALVKKRNRRLEVALREAEVIWSIVGPDRYPAQALNDLWKVLLLNQFHDIIPGSSIKRVYKEAHEHYDMMEGALIHLLNGGERMHASSVNTRGIEGPVVVRNSLSWDRDDTLVLPGSSAGFAFFDLGGRELLSQTTTCDGAESTLVRTQAPALGHTVLSRRRKPATPEAGTLRASPKVLENGLLRVEFAADGTLRRIYDKEARREVLADGPGNQFCLYEDRPTDCDAWNVEAYYMETRPTNPRCESIEVVESGPVRATVRVTLSDRNYSVVQDISLTEGSPRLDFRTHVHWQESNHSLRVQFPVNVQSNEASYEVQFGHVRRPTHQNTSWDVARFEVVAHRWADLSQPNYGVALLNDCKYGHQVLGNMMSLHLLRSPKSPDPEADMHQHTFTYALLPHQGDLVHSDVLRRAHELNVPLRGVPTGSHSGRHASHYSAMTVDSPAVVVEALKKAEADDTLIVRLYEAYGTDAAAKLVFQLPVQRVDEVNLMESPLGRIPLADSTATVRMKPFEVKTLRLTLRT